MKKPLKKKVYVLIESVPYEGYCSPRGVFSSYELAYACLEKTGKRDKDDFDILEYTLDVPFCFEVK